jgi:hypothetical protein
MKNEMARELAKFNPAIPMTGNFTAEDIFPIVS